MCAEQVQLFLQLSRLNAVQFHSRWMALSITAVLMMAAASDVSMATGIGNCASNRQVRQEGQLPQTESAHKTRLYRTLQKTFQSETV